MKIKKIVSGIYQVINSNLFIITNHNYWELRVGIDYLNNEWIESFKTKKDALSWIKYYRTFLESNGVKFYK